MSAAESIDTSVSAQTLSHILRELCENQYPIVQNPPNLKKRASVAVIIRIQPRYAHWPRKAGSFTWPSHVGASARLTSFFEQDWVQHGDPEILFIKRAARKGDRWQGHVALPGGGRDPEDHDDQAAAIRETSEEVGIELTEENSIAVGNLPQRLITTSWGKIPLMVLCPYVFLLTRPDIPPLRLQPTEIASTHWVPLRALLSPELRTYERQDVSSRLAKQEFGIKRWLFRAMLGQMLFAAIRLIPSESVYCSSIPGFVPEVSRESSIRFLVAKHLLGMRNIPVIDCSKPLLLWGLTLGVVADLLELLPPHDALEVWTYPTFSPPDVRFIIWALSYNFRKRKQREISLGHEEKLPMIELGLDAVSSATDTSRQAGSPEGGISGLGTGSFVNRRNRRESRSSAVGLMLEGYYAIVRKGVALTLFTRASVLMVLCTVLWRRYRR